VKTMLLVQVLLGICDDIAKIEDTCKSRWRWESRDSMALASTVLAVSALAPALSILFTSE
jgi:hypothetical protein